MRLILTAALAGASLASAQDVVLGTGNKCSDDRVKVKCEDGCRKAMEAAPEAVSGSVWNGGEKEKNWPSGCYFCDDVTGCSDGVWFNNHKKGSANGGAAPLCVLLTWDDGCGGGGGDHVDFLFAGDSDIQYWPNDMRNEVSSDSVNKGVGGYTCARLAKKIGGMLKKYTPEWTVLVCGENDMPNWKKAFRNFKKIVKKINKSGSRVLYIGTKPEPSTTNLHSKYRKYDQKIRAYTASLAGTADRPPLVMVDSYKGFEDLGNPNDLYSDGLHLSRKGYGYWKEWAVVAIGAAGGGSPCTVWQSNECTQPGSRRLDASLLV